MTSVAAWALGWTVFVISAGLALIAMEYLAAGPGVAEAVLGAGGTMGMAYGAYQAALVRRRGDRGAAGREAAAWGVAGVFAFGLFILSAGVPEPPRAYASLPPEYLRGIRLLVWFGALGGFLGAAAAAGWRLRIGVFVRGVAGAMLWAGLVLGCGIAALMGIYLGGHLVADALGLAALPVAGGVSGLLTGALLGSVGEAINGWTHRYPA